MNGLDFFSKRQILIVDDDEGLNRLAQKVLKRAGFSCHGALTGADAISKVKVDSRLILLVDQQLPDMDGTGLIRSLTKDGCAIPFVAMTGHGDEKIAVEFMKLGARDYLTKGVDLTKILPRLFQRLFKELETEEKLSQAEKTLHDSRALYKSLLESTKAIAYEVDLNSLTFTYISPQVYEITGYSVEKWKNFDFWLNTLHPEDKETCVNFCMKETQKGKNHELEYRMIHADGQVIWLKDLVSLIKKKGKPVALQGFLIDITKRKNMEARLQKTQKMESIGNLAGGIAHDFNNLLFPIIGMSEMLLEDLPEDSLEYENAKEIFHAGERAGKLVKQILAFSRQSEHKMTLIRVQNVLKEVVKLCRSTIPINIDIQQNIQQNCGLVMADSTQIHQVAMNLITNAFHAVENKNGTIDIALKEIILKNNKTPVGDLQSGHYVRLAVSDDGIGMAQSTLQKIFDPYFTTKEQGKGTGLGLSVVYGIVKEHGGDIKVCSEVGKGTTFSVYLPLIKKASEMKAGDQSAGIPTGTESILLVDDDVSVAKLEGQMLSRLGYQVTVKTSSNDTLNTFKSNPDFFDLVISDMTMPNMTGDQLAKEILLIKQDTPIIICTGFSERINKKQAEIMGVKGFLMKPVIKSDMAQMVRNALDEAKYS